MIEGGLNLITFFSITSIDVLTDGGLLTGKFSLTSSPFFAVIIKFIWLVYPLGTLI